MARCLHLFWGLCIYLFGRLSVVLRSKTVVLLSKSHSDDRASTQTWRRTDPQWLKSTTDDRSSSTSSREAAVQQQGRLCQCIKYCYHQDFIGCPWGTSSRKRKAGLKPTWMRALHMRTTTGAFRDFYYRNLKLTQLCPQFWDLQQQQQQHKGNVSHNVLFFMFTKKVLSIRQSRQQP